MALPKVQAPSETVNVAGADVVVRGLSFAEVGKVQDLVQAGDVGAANALMLHFATGETVEECAEFLATATTDIAAPLFLTIQRLSGVDEGARFQS